MTEQTGNTNPLADASNLATVLAALRLFQRTYEGSEAEDIYEAFPEHFEPVDGKQPMPLGTEDIDTLCEQLNCGDGIAPAPAPAKIEPGPHDARFITKAKEQYQSGSDGDIDIDDSPVVSQSDNGAYVAMWGWVSNEDAGLCTLCGEPADDGEGFDGLCGNCADKAQCSADECNTTVNPEDPYFATPCGTYCSEHMREHAQTCEVCRKAFPELAS